MYVLYFDIARRPRRRFEQEVDAGILSVLHFAPERSVATELGDRAGGDRLGGKRIGMGGIDAYELGAAAEIDLDELPAMGELALGICRCR